jgi:hypothetical protein
MCYFNKITETWSKGVRPHGKKGIINLIENYI